MRIIDEICNKGDLESYRTIISSIYIIIQNEGFELLTRYDIGQSSLNWSNKSIRISLKKKDNLFILWDLLHEFGHLLSKRKDEKDMILGREKVAWDYAEIELKKHDKLIAHLNNFCSYRDYCLSSYN